MISAATARERMVRTMAEYIDKALLKELLERYGCDKDLLGIVDCIPTDEDVLRVVRCRDCVYEQNCTLPGVPVVRCKDCEYSYDEISYLCCSNGVCVDCEVPPNFYCAYGKRRAEKEPPEEGET